MLFECDLPGRPYVKKNTARHYKFGVVYSKQFKSWERNALLILMSYKITIEDPIEAHFFFYFLNHQAEPDLSNICEGVQDVLEKAKIIKNDRLIYKLVATKQFGETPKTKVRLYGIS